MFPFTSEQKVDGSYPDLTDSFDAFFYDQGMKFYLDDPPGNGGDECTATRRGYTGYTSGGRFNYCKQSDGKLDDEPYLVVNSGDRTPAILQ